MASFGAREVKEGNFMPTFKVEGQVYHSIGSFSSSLHFYRCTLLMMVIMRGTSVVASGQNWLANCKFCYMNTTNIFWTLKLLLILFLRAKRTSKW